MNKNIFNHVNKFCKSNELELLHVADSGSRAWGYDSPNSDYDVKVLFKHRTEQYKNYFVPSEFYTLKQDEMYEYTFWDIKKVLGLLWKGNANVYELFNSPVVYETVPDVLKLKNFADNVLTENIQSVMYHYYGLAHSTYKERIVGSGEPTAKKYLYVIRPLVHVCEMLNTKKLPELCFEKALQINKDMFKADVFEIVQQVLTDKKNGNLGATVKYRYELLDKFCEQTIEATRNYLVYAYGDDEPDYVYRTKENFNDIYKYYVY